MKTVEVEIEGTTPLLQCRFNENAEQPGSTRTVLVARGTPREEAEKVTYRSPDKKTFWFPGAAIARMLREVGGGHKMKGSRKSAKYLVPAAVLVLDDTVTILNGENSNSHPVADYEVDSRPVVIPATKGRVMRHRPRFDKWGARFKIRINETILEEKFIHQLLNEGGQQNGIGEYRPEKGGPFGTFRVVHWKETK
jgi:hypothetical protein